ncbi:hypothetical protein K8I61_15405 [bacterium]|nr:hypothetical protein [bacterium]
MRNLRKFGLACLCVAIFAALVGCTQHETVDETGADVADDDSDDDAADDDVADDDASDDDDAACEDGDAFCDEADNPVRCVDGEWVAGDPCGKWTYCNFGACVETFIDFPADESPHQDMIEWWYWTGNAFDEDGNAFGFELTFFYGASLFRLPAWMINVAVLDEVTGEHTEAVWLDFGWADRDPEQLNLLSRDASVTRGLDFVYRLLGATPGHSFDLTLTDTQGPTYHGGNGIIRMSSRATDSFYYSRMRLAVEGEIDRGDGPIAVTGEGWMDHQWGNFNPFVLIGWDWFSLQMDDGGELMFFVFRGDEADPSVWDLASGTYVTPEGDQVALRMEDVEIASLSEWTSPNTGATYPMDWRLAVPMLDIDVTLTSMIDDAEMENPMWNYWEGLVFIDGEREGLPVGGAGFVELSGYAGRPLLWWLFPEMWEK